MTSGDDGWDDPVPLPEDDDNGPAAYGAAVPTPAEPAAAAPPVAPAGGGPSGGGSSGGRRGLLYGGGALAVIAIAVVAVVVSGGSDKKPKHKVTPPPVHLTTTVDHTTTTTTPDTNGSDTLTHDQFLEQANEICSSAIPAIQADDQAQNFSATVSDDETLADALTSLNTSSADTSIVRTIVRELDAAATALQSGDFTTSTARGHRFSQLAEAAGITEC